MKFSFLTNFHERSPAIFCDLSLGWWKSNCGIHKNFPHSIFEIFFFVRLERMLYLFKKKCLEMIFLVIGGFFISYEIFLFLCSLHMSREGKLKTRFICSFLLSQSLFCFLWVLYYWLPNAVKYSHMSENHTERNMYQFVYPEYVFRTVTNLMIFPFLQSEVLLFLCCIRSY